MKWISASLLALVLAASPAFAKNGVKIGVLTCDVSAGVGLILGGTQKASCVFDGPNGQENYKGRIQEIGIDIGVTAETIMSWVVFAPGKLGPGALAGTYAGATAEATFAVGLGANVLVGGSQSSVALQPLSVQGQTGLNIAAGLAKFTLEYAN
jgi:hypothetical protein